MIPPLDLVCVEEITRHWKILWRISIRNLRRLENRFMSTGAGIGMLKAKARPISNCSMNPQPPEPCKSVTPILITGFGISLLGSPSSGLMNLASLTVFHEKAGWLQLSLPAGLWWRKESR